MSTMHHNVSYPFLRGGLALVISGLFSVGPNSAMAGNAALRPDDNALSKVRADLVAELKARKDLPDTATPEPAIHRDVRWSDQSDGKRLLVPVVIRYTGLANSYCRLATVSAGLDSPKLIQLPAQADIDHCSGFFGVRYVDANNDGVLDVFQETTVKSNRYDITVSVVIAYLSDKSSEGGYCYSAALSRQLASENMVSEQALEQSIDVAMRRLGPGVLDCDPQ